VAVAQLSSNDWQQVRRAVENGRYHASAFRGALRAENPGQAYNVTFGLDGIGLTGWDSSGLEWRLDLRLRGYGCESELSLLPAVSPEAQSEGVEYRRGALTEWYLNRPEGLEQGFTVREPPAHLEKALVIEMEVQGDLGAITTADGVSFRDASGATVVSYAGLRAWQADGRALPARARAYGGRIRLEVDAGGALFPVTVDPTFVREARFLPQAEPGYYGATFGSSVAIDGDTLVVGSNEELDGFGGGRGLAYVFMRVGSEWRFQQELLASDGAPNDHFGTSVAITGDTIVIGAPNDDTTAGAEAGSAYVFVRSGTVWSEQQKLVASDGAAGDRFGSSVSADGERAVVGAPWNNTTAGNTAGSAYVFTRLGAIWSEEQQLAPSDSAANDYFGHAVAMSGGTIVIGGSSAYVFFDSGAGWTEQQKLLASDGTAVGGSLAIDVDTVVTGEPNAEAYAGAAHVFVRSGTVWTEQQKLLASDGAPFDLFGASVSINGDTAVVGADQALLGPGSAYVFVRSGSVWTEQQKLLASDGATDDRFGLSVSISGDTAVIGTPWDDTIAGPDAGSAYVFERAGSAWNDQKLLAAPPVVGTSYDRFGFSVALEGDTLAVGAPGDVNTTGYQAGAAYVFVRLGTAWSLQQKIYPPPDAVVGASFGTSFGNSVSLSGDTLAVGGPADSGGRGAAWAFVLSGGVWTEQQKLLPSDPNSFLGGAAVSIRGDTIVMGSPGAAAFTGAAYVWVRSSGFWSEQQTLTASDGAAGDYFGWAVSLDGDTVAIGAYNDDTPAGGNAGSAYVFVRSGSVWNEQQKLVASDGLANDWFGEHVALDGDTAAIGAEFHDTVAGPDAGSAYVFVRSGSIWSEQQRLVASDSDAFDFGLSVSVESDTAVIGSASDPFGAAYVFVRSGTAWAEVQKILPNDPGPTNTTFGSAVSVNGGSVAVGAYLNGPNVGGVTDVFRQITATDVGVAKTDGQTTAVPGLPLTYTIAVTDTGPDPGVGVRVTDTPPAALTNVGWTCSATPGSYCPDSGSGAIDHVANVDVNGMLTYSLTGTVSPSATGSLVNTGTVAAPLGVVDPDPANDSATDTDVLTPQADLALSLSDSPDPIRAKGTLICSLDVTNAGPSDSTGVGVTGTLPPEATFVSSMPGPPTCVGAGGSVACNLPGAAPGSSQTVTVQALVHPGTLGTILGSGSVAGNEPDPVSSNDSATQTTQVILRDGELVHGSRVWADLGSVAGLADQDDYRIAQKPYASYEVVLDGISGDLGAQGPDLERVASDGAAVIQTSVAATGGSSRSLRWENVSASAVSGEYVRVQSAGCTVACSVEDVYRLRAFETTLRVTRFNNSASQVTVLLVQNPTALSIAGHVYFWSSAGTLLATHPFVLPARQELVLNTSSVPDVAGQGGSITISHDGPFGVLAGKAVAVEPATGFTFDSALESHGR
jgi:uncharacterized repeat protein (TIGR01451 family)